MSDDGQGEAPAGPEPDGGMPGWRAEPAGGSYQAPGDLRVGTRRRDGCVLTSTGHWVRTEPERP